MFYYKYLRVTAQEAGANGSFTYYVIIRGGPCDPGIVHVSGTCNWYDVAI